MTYVDSSVLLRWVLDQPDALPGVDDPVTSVLAEVECRRAVDKDLAAGRLPQREARRLSHRLDDLLARIDAVPLGDDVLRRAASSFPLPIATLDALHVATALKLAQEAGRAVRFATHDRQQGRCARACGLDVQGVAP